MIDGKLTRAAKDRTKNKSSHRVLPLVPEFAALLTNLKNQRDENRDLCKSAYNKDGLEYICADDLGNLIKSGFVTQKFITVPAGKNLRKIRYHDLRHSCASLLLANGVSMKEILDWLGHSDFGTTANIYD